MACFPFFVELEGVRGLVAGGGPVALRKVRQLLSFGARLTVCAPSLLPEFEVLEGVRLVREAFSAPLLDGQRFVIAATGDLPVNREIAALCRVRGIPVNAADDPQACDFLFPALIREGPLCIGISTGGASPAAAAYLRRTLAAQLPDGLGAILDYLAAVREPLKRRVPAERRGACFAALLEACLQRSGPLSSQELDRLADTFSQGEGDGL